MAKLIAKEYFGDEKSLIRVDMSEFMEKYSISKLIGSAP
ncbi:AAA domain-containing protein [bacterium]|nr:AAA domain-containing protein [bacterium]